MPSPAEVPSTFQVIAEPTRRRILDLLFHQERSVGDLVAELALNQPAVSKHLRVLRQADLVRAEVSAQRRLYRLNPAPLAELDAWLEPYRQFWNERLDALGRHLDRRAAEAAREEPGRVRSEPQRSNLEPQRARRAAARPPAARPPRGSTRKAPARPRHNPRKKPS